MPASTRRRTRRSFLTGATALVVALAGCATGDTDPGAETDGSGSPGTVTSPPSTTATTDAGTASTSSTTSSPAGASTSCPDREDVTMTYDADAACPGYRLADLVVFPPDGEESTVTVRIVRLADGAVRLDETVTTDGDPVAFRDPVTDAGRHRVTVSLADGQSATHVWAVPESEVETDAHGLQASVGTDGVAFSEVVN